MLHMIFFLVALAGQAVLAIPLDANIRPPPTNRPPGLRAPPGCNRWENDCYDHLRCLPSWPSGPGDWADGSPSLTRILDLKGEMANMTINTNATEIPAEESTKPSDPNSTAVEAAAVPSAAVAERQVTKQCCTINMACYLFLEDAIRRDLPIHSFRHTVGHQARCCLNMYMKSCPRPHLGPQWRFNRPPECSNPEMQNTPGWGGVHY